MAHDPFAVSPDLANREPAFRLPALHKWDLGLCDFQIWDRLHGVRRLHGFADFWTDSMGGPASVARHVRASFEGAPTQDRKLGLFAATLSAWAHDDLLATYPLAFGCAAKADKLAAEMVSGMPHPADPIFEAGLEEDFARGLASAIKAHLASDSQNPIPKDHRWSLLMLLQGHARRRIRLPAFAIYAVAATLGLLDANGYGRANLPLVGIIERRALIERAAERAFTEAEDDFEFDHRRIPAEERTDGLFEEHPIFWLAVNDNLRRLGASAIAPPDDDDNERSDRAA